MYGRILGDESDFTEFFMKSLEFYSKLISRLNEFHLSVMKEKFAFTKSFFVKSTTL